MNILKPIFAFLAILFLPNSKSSLFAQTNKELLQQKLIEYHSTPKEVAYLHLNKSSYLNGEQLAFTAYVSTARDLKPSLKTTNLYVQIKDSANTVLKEKLVLIDKGVGSNLFNIDSTFTGGNYTITAYTNWMKNFDQHYFFTENFQVLKTNLDDKQEKIELQNIDAQFLPESGHLVANTINKLGVIVKDPSGYGLSNATVELLNAKEEIIETTTLDKFGIGRINLNPKFSEAYKARIRYRGNEFFKDLDIEIFQKGILLSPEIKENGIVLQFRTNQKTLKDISKEEHTLTIQNSRSVKAISVVFEGNTILQTNLPFRNMEAGINILTLWDSKSNPVAERLIFNPNNLPVVNFNSPRMIAEKDSLKFRFKNAPNVDTTFFSISILPEETTSYDRKNSILTQFMLRPYLKGHIEGGDWYLKDLTENKLMALDNLLLTQGWSSYNWKDIFNNLKESPKYDFERYLSITGIANGSTEKERNFIVHASSTNPLSEITLPPGKDSFILENLVPMEGEDLFISKKKSKGSLVPAGLAMRFQKKLIGQFGRPTNFLSRETQYIPDDMSNYFTFMNNFGQDAEMLDEVLVETSIDPDLERERKLSTHAWGKVHVITDNEKMMFTTLAQYLRANNFSVQESPGGFIVNGGLSLMTSMNSSVSSGGSDNTFSQNIKASSTPEPDSEGMAIFLDGFPLAEKAMLYQFPMINIDYIEINRRGMGGGILEGNGSIKIYLDYTGSKNTNIGNRVQSFEFPVSFAANKQYYVPKYPNRFDEFFKNYGVIDWKGQLLATQDEPVEFKILKPEVDFQLIVEGFSSNGNLIHQVINLERPFN
ncbi:hypothetical protein ACNI3T_05770 [Christiangramia sp. ASW11-125]|uniref:hypothetical protein n=1 Tax=Christiangramia sp. ASW11-125 TaxID=3400701 RepID=UPI003AAC51E8